MLFLPLGRREAEPWLSCSRTNSSGASHLPVLPQDVLVPAGGVSAGREVKADGIRLHPHLQFPATTLSPQDGAHVLTRPLSARVLSLIDGAELEMYRAQDLCQGGW